MPVWGVHPEDVDLDIRISNISYWVLCSIRKYADIYFLDPSWIMAIIMEESFFYEYALSSIFAAGICQFTLNTANSFGMICPDTHQVENARLSRSESAGALDRMRDLQERKRRVMNTNKELFYNQDALLEKSLQHHVNGSPLPEAERMLDAMREKESLEESIQNARREYKGFLQANYEGRSIFNQKDLAFFLRFDERVTYQKPIDAMVKMFAKYMRGRNGNVLVATAGYNAGLSRTYSSYAVYEPYGLIPNYDQTVSYVSKIVVNHHEIVQRLTG
jgi:hypothetical protein